jgi:SAM-dependent methyltransferase
MVDLTDAKTHFQFGENWARFAGGLSEAQIASSVAGMAKLVGDNLSGRTFLDIGCGSGIHALAALRLGAASVVAVDLDPRAADTARSLLARHAPARSWTVETRSVFDIACDAGHYDIVYSWGVLHHTGAMRQAIEQSASLVRPGGQLVIAIYRKTPMCSFWRIEKCLYSRGPHWYRAIADVTFSALLVLGLSLAGRNPVRYIRNYQRARGMRFLTDVRDWLGGYPYESASPAEVGTIVEALGFYRGRFFPCSTRIGLLGVGCDEYVFYRRLGSRLLKTSVASRGSP